MTKSEANQARRELQHALDALGDGAGAEEWGTGTIAEKLHWHAWDAETMSAYTPRARAYQSWMAAAAASVKLGTRTRDQVITCMRRVAPVLLEVLLEMDEGRCATCEQSPCHALCGSQLR